MLNKVQSGDSGPGADRGAKMPCSGIKKKPECQDD